MLGLTLRDEFRGKRLKGTAIELSNDSNTGATQIAAQQFLEITYPTHDLLKGIEAVGPNQGRPVVVIGERGLGKSHLMAALYHAVNDAVSTRAWLNSWATTLGDANIGKIALRDGMLVIGESLHRQRYKFLVQLFVFRILADPFLRLHFSACEDEQIAIQKSIGRARSGQQEANGVAALLQMILEPTTQCLIDFFRLFRQYQNGQTVIPALGLLGLVE